VSAATDPATGAAEHGKGDADDRQYDADGVQDRNTDQEADDK
jgi:hypothetical protein